MVTAAGCGLTVSELTVRFGGAAAVDGLSIDVAPGEIVALVGPSGSGKSTLLRAVAGLEATAAGTVRWDGRDLTDLRPDQRGFGLMFQDHALFAHRDVAANVAFGLRMQGRDRAEQRRRVAELLARVGLDGFGHRRVETLSGGEAQRVALARALAPQPRLLMLDEPLGSLDRVLRDRLARDLREVLHRLGVAALHVTHDQEEAYGVADRVAVVRAGRLVRAGPAQEVWADPRSEFVARFLGHDNVLDAATARRTGLGDGSVPVVVREAAVAVHPAGSASGRFDARVTDVRFRGSTSRVELEVGSGADAFVLAVHLAEPPPPGSTVRLALDSRHVTALADPIR